MNGDAGEERIVVRPVLKIALFLLLGAVLTVGVALLCSFAHAAQVSVALGQPQTESTRSVWLGTPPPNFPSGARHKSVAPDGVGYRRLELGNQVTTYSQPPTAASPGGKGRHRGYSETVVYAGWPLPSLTGVSWKLEDTQLGRWQPGMPTGPKVTEWAEGIVRVPQTAAPSLLHADIVLPLRPYWPGFVPSVLFYTLACWMLWILLSLPRLVRKGFRMIAWRCPGCGYPISATCTECGRSAGEHDKASGK